MHNRNRLIRILALVAYAALPASASAQTPIGSIKVADGLTTPAYVAAPRGDPERLFICELKTGLVKILRGGAVLPTPFLDVSATLDSSFHHGLMSIAFHPDYWNNGFVYAYYSFAPGTTVIERYTVSATAPDVVDPASAVTILSVPQPFGDHNGGTIQFDPLDGYLFLAFGDGGSPGDPACRAQDPTTLLGKMIRIDVDGGFPYAIPATNPFVGDPGVLDEIWAFGLRNPFRFGIDRLNGDVYIGDVGQSDREEISYQPGGVGGLNYGWSVKEGSICFVTTSCTTPTCNDAGFTDPIREYTHSSGCASTGGLVYRGCAIPGLVGTYFYADFCTNGTNNGLWSLRMVGGQVTESRNRTAELNPPGPDLITNIVAFGEDGYGELYVVDYSGEVFKIVPDEAIVDCNGNGVHDPCELGARPALDCNGNGVLDECEQVGTAFCTNAVPNTTGRAGTHFVSGVDAPGAQLALRAADLPPNQFGYFLTSLTTGSFTPPGSAGVICLANDIGRYSGQAQNSGGEGVFCTAIDTSSMPVNPPAPVLSGETWHFQCWYRDSGSSNFTNGVSVLFN